jgi:hypothetical protein
MVAKNCERSEGKKNYSKKFPNMRKVIAKDQ